MRRLGSCSVFALILTLLVFAPAPAAFAWDFPNQQVADKANSYPDGYNGGQCKNFATGLVVDPVLAANGHPTLQGYGAPGGCYYGAYANGGGVLVGVNDAQPGDLIQAIPIGYTHSDYPPVDGLHTAIVVGVDSPGNYQVRDSNWNLDERVRTHPWTPSSWSYKSEIYVWRFGTLPPSDPSLNSRNLLANASFEHSMNGWKPIAHSSAGNWYVYNNPAYAHDGGGYLEASTSVSGFSIGQEVAVAPKPGESYTFSVWLRSPTSNKVSGTVALWGAGGTSESTGTSFTVGPQWTLVSAPLDVANSGHTKMVAEIYISSTGRSLDIDGAQLVGCGLANASFEHSMNGWKPIAHSSAGNWYVYNNPAYAHDGGGYLEASTSVSGFSIGQEVAVAPKPGESYTFSVWLRSPTSNKVSGTVALWGAGGTSESTGTSFTVGPQWTLVSAPLDVANSGHTKMVAEIYISSTGRSLDIDGATLAPGNARVPADTTPPTTTLSGLPSGWVRRTVTLTFSATDSGGSGLARTEYRIDDGAWQTGNSLSLIPSGVYDVDYRSLDKAGNTETAKSATVRIDKTRPVAKALYNRSVRRGRYVRLYYRVNDRISPKAKTVKIRIYRGSRRIKTITLRNRPTNKNLSYRFRCNFARGRYVYKVTAVDLAGKVSRQTTASRKTLWVR